MPLVSKTFSQIITFTRASTATYFDSAGVLQSAAIDAPRFDYNPATLAAQGLLIEESRTNEITSSAVLPVGVASVITADAFTAPDNTTTGDQILDNATLSEHYSDSLFTPTAATNYTFSAFIKNIGALSSNFACLRMAGDFNAYVFVNLSTFALTNGGANFVSSSIQAVGNGWYRVSVTGLSNGTATLFARIQVANSISLSPYSGTGEGFAVWGRQLEAGAFPTSYIPTTSTALTRAADVASVNTLSPWYNNTEYTLYYEGMVQANSDGLVYTGVGDTFDNTVYFSRSAPNQTLFVRSGGVGQTGPLLSTFTPTAGTPFKMAAGIKANDFGFCVNGGTVAVDTAGNMPLSAVRFGIGNSPWAVTGGNQKQQWLRRVTYYPRRLSNAELVSLTS